MSYLSTVGNLRRLSEGPMKHGDTMQSVTTTGGSRWYRCTNGNQLLRKGEKVFVTGTPGTGGKLGLIHEIPTSDLVDFLDDEQRRAWIDMPVLGRCGIAVCSITGALAFVAGYFGAGLF